MSVTSPTPLTVQMSGLRVKLPYDTFAEVLRKTEIEDGITIGDIADIETFAHAGLHHPEGQAVLGDEHGDIGV